MFLCYIFFIVFRKYWYTLAFSQPGYYQYMFYSLLLCIPQFPLLYHHLIWSINYKQRILGYIIINIYDYPRSNHVLCTSHLCFNVSSLWSVYRTISLLKKATLYPRCKVNFTFSQ